MADAVTSVGLLVHELIERARLSQSEFSFQLVGDRGKRCRRRELFDRGGLIHRMNDPLCSGFPERCVEERSAFQGAGRVGRRGEFDRRSNRAGRLGRRGEVGRRSNGGERDVRSANSRRHRIRFSHLPLDPQPSHFFLQGATVALLTLKVESRAQRSRDDERNSSVGEESADKSSR